MGFGHIKYMWERTQGCCVTTTAHPTSASCHYSGHNKWAQTSSHHSCQTSLAAERTSVRDTVDGSEKHRNGWWVTGGHVNMRGAGGKTFGGTGVYWEVRAAGMQWEQLPHCWNCQFLGCWSEIRFRRRGQMQGRPSYCHNWRHSRCMSQESRTHCAMRKNDMMWKLPLWGGKHMFTGVRRQPHMFWLNHQTRWWQNLARWRTHALAEHLTITKAPAMFNKIPGPQLLNTTHDTCRLRLAIYIHFFCKSDTLS